MVSSPRSTETELAIIANELMHIRDELKTQGREIHEIQIENARIRRLVNFGTGGFFVLVFIGGLVAWFLTYGLNLWNSIKQH